MPRLGGKQGVCRRLEADLMEVERRWVSERQRGRSIHGKLQQSGVTGLEQALPGLEPIPMAGTVQDAVRPPPFGVSARRTWTPGARHAMWSDRVVITLPEMSLRNERVG